MDLIGDIIEKNVDTDDTNNPNNKEDLLNFNIIEKNIDESIQNTGFPELYRPQKISSWKQRLREKKRKQHNKEKSNITTEIPSKSSKPINKTSDVDAIHLENLNVLQNMSNEEILNEQKELLSSLSPKLIQNLLKNIKRRQNVEDSDNPPLFAEIEGASGTWVGGLNENLPKLDPKQVEWALQGKNSNDTFEEGQVKKDTDETKHVSFNTDSQFAHEDSDEGEDMDDLDDIAPLDYQMAQSIDHMTNEDLLKDVHFMKKLSVNDSDNEEDIMPLDINDPNFNEKLHEKFFPDLPKDVEKLKWMEQVPELPDDNDPSKFIIDDVSMIRFDFNGNLVPPTRKINNTIRSGLHHHSTDPQLAGYTLLELNRLAKSTFAPQRCIAIQTLGRILYKLGKQSYYQLVPEIDSETYKEDGSIQNVMNKIYAMFWDLIKSEEMILTLEVASDEKLTKNLSVRTYAIDALWLWKKGGGDFRGKTKDSNSK